jgi:hypothetical protein
MPIPGLFDLALQGKQQPLKAGREEAMNSLMPSAWMG